MFPWQVVIATACFLTIPVFAQNPAQPPAPAAPAPLPPGQSNDPYPQPIAATEGVIRVNVREFAALPDIDGVAARMMRLVDDPATKRFYVNDMRGPIYTVSYDGKAVNLYLDMNDPKWGVSVQSQGRERGFQNFALHPDFGRPGTPGAGKIYAYVDTTNQTPTPDFTAPSPKSTHDAVLLEWTAKTPTAAAYDGEAPRELMRWRHPFGNHNGGHVAFNPTAPPGSAERGHLYLGIADGGSGGDPMNLSQNLESSFGKVFRIDPLGKNSLNGKYGIPADNPFVKRPDALPEIFALGVRNPQRFGWDMKSGRMYLADIGQNIIEEISPVTAGANLGWNRWEGNYRFVNNSAVSLENPRSDPAMTYPIVEWGQPDPLLQSQSAATGVIVYRSAQIPALANRIIFADMPSGEIFHVSADNVPNGGQDPIRRILLNDGGSAKTLLEIIQTKNEAQGKKPATRSDLRLDESADGRVFLLNKGDGIIRVLTP
jgi:glucose/arabinose dehydrogenase